MSVYRPKINLLNLERLPTKVEDLIEGTPYPERIEFLMLDIVTHPEHKEIEYKDIMHWRERARYLRRVGQAKEANELERAEAKALQDAKDADGDEDFMTGFNDFLANEFDLD